MFGWWIVFARCRCVLARARPFCCSTIFSRSFPALVVWYENVRRTTSTTQQRHRNTKKTQMKKKLTKTEQNKGKRELNKNETKKKKK